MTKLLVRRKQRRIVVAAFVCASLAVGRLASATDPSPASASPVESAAQPEASWGEYTNTFEGLPGRGSRLMFDLAIPRAGLYQVNWQAEVYSLDPHATLNGTCTIADDPAGSFYLDAANYDAETPSSGFTSNGGSTLPHYYRRVGGTFVAYIAGGTDLVLRCVSSAAAAAATAPSPDKILSAAMFARKLD